MSNDLSTVAATISFSDMEKMAGAIAKSGLFGIENQDQALALMFVAQAEGRHPATIAQDYDIIKGRAARKTNSVLARFQQFGGVVEWHSLTESVADATFTHRSGGSVRMTWTIEQARESGLLAGKFGPKENWKNYPRAMLRARCIAEGVRAVFPAAIGGMLTREEEEDLSERNKGHDQVTASTAPAQAAQPRQQPAEYPQANLDANLPKWRALIEGGKSTAERVLAMIGTRYTLSPEQRAAIMALGTNTSSGVIEGELVDHDTGEIG